MAQWRFGENGVDHSLFALYKCIAVALGHDPANFLQSLSIYLALSALGGTLLYFLRIRHLPLLNQLLILTIASINFTAFSGDGTLLHLYYPFALLLFLTLGAWKRRTQVPGLLPALLCFAVLLAPESYLVAGEWRFEGEVKCLILGYLLVLALRHPFGPSLTQSFRIHETLINALAHPEPRHEAAAAL